MESPERIFIREGCITVEGDDHSLEGFRDVGELDLGKLEREQHTGYPRPAASNTSPSSFEEAFDDYRQDDIDANFSDEQLLINAAIEHAAEAAQFESTAMDHDRRAMAHDRTADVKQAIANYQVAAEKLAKAASLCPEGLPDKAVLSRHAGEVLGRVVYLESLGGAPATAPLEQHIGSVQLTLGAAPDQDQYLSDDEEAEALGFEKLSYESALMMADEDEMPSLKKRAASAAAITGAAGLLVLHAPVCAVAMSCCAAYATTRKDYAGSLAKTVGDVGIRTAGRAQSFAEECRIPQQINKGVGLVLTDRGKEKAVSSLESLKSFNRKHQVTKTIGQGASAAANGVASATSSISSWVQNAIKK